MVASKKYNAFFEHLKEGLEEGVRFAKREIQLKTTVIEIPIHSTKRRSRKK